MERFNLKKSNEAEGKKKSYIEVSNRFAALEDLNVKVEMNGGWETIRISKFWPERVCIILN
jgi:hypothetical protein